MSLTRELEHPCPRCAAPVAVRVHQSLVIDSEAASAFVRDGHFNWLVCGACGERRPLQVDLLVTDKARNLLVQVVSDDAKVVDAIAAMHAMRGDEPIKARIVAGREGLVEKVELFSRQMDDVAIEVVKQMLRAQRYDVEGLASVYFERVDGEQLVFRWRIHPEPVEYLSVPLMAYHNVCATLDTAAHIWELEVDERLARGILKRESAESTKSARCTDPLLLRYRSALRARATRAFRAGWVETEGEPTVRSSARAPFLVERFHVPGPVPLHIAVTNGLGAVPVAGHFEGPVRIELAAMGPCTGPRLLNALSLLGQTLHDEARPGQILDWDRLVFREPIHGGIAGGILRPFVALESVAAQPVSVFDLLPILSDELELFRREPTAHAQWVEARKARRDEAELHLRWRALFD